MKTYLSLALVVVMSACTQAPNGTYSLRASIAESLAPDNGPAINRNQFGPKPEFMPIYEADFSRIQAGMRAVNVSQVEIWGGKVWGFGGKGYDNGHEVALVAECETVPVQLNRADNLFHGGTLIYLTRYLGMIYVTDYELTGCQLPIGVRPVAWGQDTLTVSGRVQAAQIANIPWGAAPYLAPFK